MAKQAAKSTDTKPKVKVTGKEPSASKNTSKFVILGIAAATIIAVIIAIIVAVNASPTINDDYFVSDGSKYVLNIDGEGGDGAVAVHVVYYYSGDSITDVKSFYEFTDEETAKTAYNELMESNDKDDASAFSLNGKYIVLAASDDEVKKMTIENVKSQIELYESFKDLDDSEDEE